MTTTPPVGKKCPPRHHLGTGTSPDTRLRRIGDLGFKMFEGMIMCKAAKTVALSLSVGWVIAGDCSESFEGGFTAGLSGGVIASKRFRILRGVSSSCRLTCSKGDACGLWQIYCSQCLSLAASALNHRTLSSFSSLIQIRLRPLGPAQVGDPARYWTNSQTSAACRTSTLNIRLETYGIMWESWIS